MTEQEIDAIIQTIRTMPEGQGELARTIFKAAADSLSLDKVATLTEQDTTILQNKQLSQNGPVLKFTEKEISNMPTSFKQEFRIQGCTAHIRKRQSGKNTFVYEIRYRRNGYNVIASSNNLEEAKRKFIEKLFAADQNKKQQIFKSIAQSTQPAPLTEVNGIPVTFDGFANYYFETFYKRKVCMETYRVTQSNYRNHVLPHFGNVPLSSITAHKCQELIDRLVDEDKARTSENVATMLNMLFTAAVKHTVLQHNPMDMVFHTKHQREHGKALSKDEERKLLEETAGTPYQLMFAVGLYTGMRPNEYKTAIIEDNFIVANNSKRKNGKVELKRISINPMTRHR